MKLEKKEFDAKFDRTWEDREVKKLIERMGILLIDNKTKEFFWNCILLTGGYIRDRIQNMKVNDYDFVLHEDYFSNLLYKLDNDDNKKFLGIDTFKLNDVKEINARLLSLSFNKSKIEIKEIKVKKEKKDFEDDFEKEENYFEKCLKKDLKFRDFCINSLYYNLHTNKILDFCNGIADLESKKLITVNSIYETFRISFTRYIRFAILYVNYEPNDELLLYVSNYFKNEKSYLERIPNEVSNIKRQMEKVFYYSNTGEIIKIMMFTGAFKVVYNEKVFLLKEEIIEALNDSIYKLITKIDFLFTQKDFLKDKFDLDEKKDEDEFRMNIYSLKTNAIVYCFYHPKFSNKKKHYFDSQKDKFNFLKIYTPGKFFELAYELGDKFNDLEFNKFDNQIKILGSKIPICKLLTLLPLLARDDKELNCLYDLSEIFKGIKLKKYDETKIFQKKKKTI